MKRRCPILCLFFLFAGLQLMAQTGYEERTQVASSGDTLLYRLLAPERVEAGKTYPLVLFLHGAGERGNDNTKQLGIGAQMFLNPLNRELYPAFVLFPQCPDERYWAYGNRPASFAPGEMPVPTEPAPITRAVKELLDSCLASSPIDTGRIYIIGLSMGGMGTYDLVAWYPGLFAAAIPICGTVNPSRLKAATDVSFRIFHGDADKVVTVEGSRQAYKTLKANGANVEYIEFPGIGHDSWTPAFNYPGFMGWLFGQKKK